MQCDIDILGEASQPGRDRADPCNDSNAWQAWILKILQFVSMTVDILKAMAAYSGFKEEDYDEVFIILDKMDKIGTDGVAEELDEMGYAKDQR